MPKNYIIYLLNIYIDKHFLIGFVESKFLLGFSSSSTVRKNVFFFVRVYKIN